MRKVLMLATTAAMIEQFNKNNILILQDMGYEVHVAGNFREGNPISDEKLSEFREWITARGGTWFHIPATRKPLDLKNNIAAYRAILKLIRANRYDFIHCHTPIGSVLGRVAAHQTGTKIIYTAHGFHFFQGAPLKNWLLYYPVERFLSRWTDVLICINHEDYTRAKKHFHAGRTEYIPGVGVDIQAIQEKQADRGKKRRELGISEDDFVVLSVGEVNKNKNHQVVVRALKRTGRKDIHYVIAGKGDQMQPLKVLANNLEIAEQVHLLGFCEDVVDLYKSSDVFAFPSKREGLGLAAIEGMSAGLPLLTSNIQGIKDYAKNGKTGYKYSWDDVNGFAKGILYLKKHTGLRKKMGAYNREFSRKYDDKRINKMMARIYGRMDEL